MKEINSEDDDLSKVKYIEGFIHKKEDEKNWLEYWAQIRGRYILLYKNKPSLENLRESFKGCIELTDSTKCIVAKRKKYNFPFYVSTDKSKYLFKVVSSVKRLEWFKAIELASQGKPMSFNLVHQTSQRNVDETSLSDEDKSSDEEIETALPAAHINTSFTSSEVDLSCDKKINNIVEDDQSENNCHVVMSTKAQIQTSRFLDRVEQPILDVDARFHQIYCADEEESKEKDKSKLFIPTFLYSKPEVYEIPPPKNMKTHEKRFFPSAECLLLSTDHRSLLNSYETNLNPGKNKNRTVGGSTHNNYSRHLVHSAPDIKT